MKIVTKTVLMIGATVVPLALLKNSLEADDVHVTSVGNTDLRIVLQGLHAAPDALVVAMLTPDVANNATTDAALGGAFALVEAIRLTRDVSGRLPRYAIGLFPQSLDAPGSAIAAAAGSLVRYVTSHLLYDDICVNLIAYPDSALGHQRAADTARALMSGLLDTVRGQTFLLTKA